MNEIKIILLAFTLAFLSESLTEYLFSPIFENIVRWRPYKFLLVYVAAGVGLGFSIHYQIDFLAMIGGVQPDPVGMIASGLIIGRGSNFLHEFVSKFLAKAMPQLRWTQ